ncbi:MAG: hypothetical protein AB7N76_19800 [Planctomycetota bacterium]
MSADGVGEQRALRSARRRAGLVLAGLGAAVVLASLARVPAWRGSPILTSLEVALCAALTALALGVPYALAVERWRVPGRRLLLALGVTPLVVPPYLAVVAWRGVFGPGGRVPLLLGVRPPVGPAILAKSAIYTAPCCGFLLGASLLPLVLLPVWAALRRLPGGSLDAARLLLGEWGERRLIARALLPAALAGALAVAALSLVEFPVPQLLRIKVQSEEVFAAFHGQNDTWAALRAASLASAPLLGLSVALAGLALALPWGGAPLAGPGGRARPLGRAGQLAAWVGCALALAPGAWLPALDVGLRLIHRPVPPGSRVPQGLARARLVLRDAWTAGAGDAERSVQVGIGAASAAVTLALVVVALGLVLARRARRAARGPARVAARGDVGRGLGRRAWLRATLEACGAAALALALACPAPLVGIAVLVGLTWAGASATLDGLSCLVLSDLARFLPFALGLLVLAARGLPRGPLEAAELAGRSPVLGVALPQLLPAAFAAWALVYVLSVTEFSATTLVAPPGLQVLSLLVVNQAHYGEVSELAGFCAMLLGVVLWPLPPLAALAWWSFRDPGGEASV